MKHGWAVIALALSASAHASDRIPAGADERRVSHSDVQRLMGLVMRSGTVEEVRHQRASYAEQKAISDEIMLDLYGPTPDLAKIERLDQRRRQLAREEIRASEARMERAYLVLSAEDRIKFMRMNYALPPAITGTVRTSPSKPSN